MAKPSGAERERAWVLLHRVNATAEELEEAFSILLRCSLSGECTAQHSHMHVIEKYARRLEALKYYQQQETIDVPL